MTQAQRNQKILAAIREETTRALSSKKAAQEMLIREGIYTTKGRLRAEFGGTAPDRATKKAAVTG